MKAVIQRVKNASVSIGKEVKTSIERGLLILLGIEENDSNTDIEWLCSKIVRLRIFGDSNGLMNLSVLDVNGEMLVVSQFTLHASTRKGNRPSFIRAAKPEIAIPLYNQFIKFLEYNSGKKIKTGEFGAHMEISLINDGPVTIIIDSKIKE